jgi:glycosyltransferase involved in cell wall biosynthesis
MMARISGVLPIKNGEKWILNTLPKILSCLDIRDELVIVDDGSTDKTLTLVSSFAENDHRIKVVKRQSRGLIEALNEGVNQSHNNWIARFDIDDSYPQDRLKKQRFEINGDVAAIFTDYRIKLNGRYNLGLIASPITDPATRLSLLRSQRTAHPSALFNKGKFISAGGYIAAEFPAEDLGLWARMSNHGTLISVDIEGLQYNFRQNSISRTNRDSIIYNKQRILDSYIETLAVNSIFEKLEENLERYRATNLGRDRTLLHLWDMTHPLSQKKLGKKKSLFARNLLIRNLSNPANWPHALRLIGGREIRKILR